MHLKKLIKRFPPLVRAYQLATTPGPTLRRLSGLRDLRRDYAALAAAPVGGDKGRLLVLGLLDDNLEALKQEAFLVKGLQQRGMDCHVLGTRMGWAVPAYRALGVPGHVYLDDFLDRGRARLVPGLAERLADRAVSFDALCALESDDGVKVGKYVASTLIRQLHAGCLDLGDPGIMGRVRQAVGDSLLLAEAAKLLLDAVRPDVCLFLERGYSPYGEFFDLALARGLDVVQWCGSQRPDAFVLKRCTPANQDSHPSTLSDKTWELLKSAPLPAAAREAVRRELFDGYATGAWFSEVGTQFRTSIMEKDAVAHALGLDPEKKTAVLFAHMFWDATLFYGKDVFRDYKEWFVETVKAACRNTALNWLIKVHPANLVKLNRDGYQGELAELAAIREAVGELPPHVHVMPPDTPVSTYSLFSVMDYCLTVRGTVGIEAAVFGVPVLTCGTGRYDRLGFTVDASGREEYLERLGRLQELPRPSEAQTELAWKYAFGVFVLRLFHFSNLRILHARDAAASIRAELLPRTPQDLEGAPDLRAFANWVLRGGDEDYLDEHFLGLLRPGS